MGALIPMVFNAVPPDMGLDPPMRSLAVQSTKSDTKETLNYAVVHKSGSWSV